MCPSDSSPRRPRVGLALGSGAARGWGHIGVLHGLTEAGIEPDIVCGSSIGALVGGAYAGGELDALEQWIRRLTWGRFLRLFDLQLTGGGFIEGDRFMDAVRPAVREMQIDELPMPFAAVATNLETGHEVWLQHGPLVDAVRASLALPGLFAPIRRDGRWLVDGGLVNPVPVSVCRALGADRVIAVNLNGDIVGKRMGSPQQTGAPRAESDLLSRLSVQLARAFRERGGDDVEPAAEREERPGLFDVLTGSINIMQDRITRSRMAGDPPDIVIAPRLAHIGLLEFSRAGEAIDEGRRSVERMGEALAESIA